MFGLLLLLAVNFGISWWNAYVVGQGWVESRMLGGWVRLLMWSGAVQSALGFSSVFLAIFGWVAHLMGWLPTEAVEPMLSLWYLLVIFPILGSGFVITIHSWQETMRDPSLLRIGTTAWNTYAQVHNTVQAFDGVGAAASSVGDMLGGLFKGDGDAKGKLSLAVVILVVLIVACALLSGALLTAYLVKRHSGTVAMPVGRAPAAA